MTEALQSRKESGLRLQEPSCSKRSGEFRMGAKVHTGWEATPEQSAQLFFPNKDSELQFYPRIIVKAAHKGKFL